MPHFVKGKKYRLSLDECEYYDQEAISLGDKKKYHYAIAEHTGDFWICDCWIVNYRGKRHPAIDVSPVPIRREEITEL